MRAVRIPLIAVAVPASLLFGVAWAGSIDLEWDPVPGATGYRAYFGTTKNQYTSLQDLGSGLSGNPPKCCSGTLQVPNNCTTYYVALKAYNGSGGVSANYSNEVEGWGHPEVASISRTFVEQGDNQLTLNIDGANFGPNALVTYSIDGLPQDEGGNDLLMLTDLKVLPGSCTRIQGLVTAEPTARGQRAMELGTFAIDFRVVNPDGIFGQGSRNLEVRFAEERADINRSDSSTIDRVDGKDLTWLAHSFNSFEGDPFFEADADLDGDGRVTGDDLALLAARFGMCWGINDTWSNSACD